MFEIVILVLVLTVQAAWLMIPAYISNPMAVVLGGGKPIDFGKNWIDGERILGDGKTIRGLTGGTICGIIAGIIQMQISPLNTLFVSPPLIAVITLSFGALFGDIVKSFFKRRMRFRRGAPLLLIDQLDFVLGAWVLTYIFDPVWFIDNFTVITMLVILVITPVLHRLTNILGYHVKLKKEPW
ncbi:MAG: CDP-2,3-bis-(O-geranylgeranyl)-sn-glycerol synthase [Candidatus Methanoperedens sp.]|nr:CDP-2,3-bis-(O-geranylgeranyl)-sn-glycerol synthase [Candidatus Methanoperedens sp.]MCZ7359598.1 CDP-2,3-bis-(O-geranylgeranyl)-sn-glycerol synthase [Candidatus Methanoperedens sp.]HLB72251.1 CDP-2,3-bis-(O-geranylgeranyl)-sn-glycerol synthase [Candidatus Methanoperedens sp.]